MKFSEYTAYDAVGLADLIRQGEVSPLEVVDAAIEGIERYDREINAIVYRAFDEARAAAAEPLPEGPFTGVPFLVKDLLLQVTGWPRTSGSRYAANAGFTDAQDSGLMRRYRASGVVTLGKTNLSEFGIAGTTEGALFGPCRNPWDLGHIVGGSSGGSAAAVASGMVPMAHGGDGLGSIRIPASCCGLVGLKVTRDRNPHLPDGYDFAQGNVVEHVITRTVRDTAVMLDVTGNPEPGSPYAIPPKERPYADEVGRDPGRLRIAWAGGTPLGRAIHPDVQGVLEDTARLLDGLGHYVEERALGINTLSDYVANLPLAGANFAAGMKRMIEAIGREPAADELEPLTWAALNGARSVSGVDALYSAQERRMRARATLRFFEDWDVFLCPVMGTPPPKIGYLDPVNVPAADIQARNGEVYPFPAPFNFTGQPSISLPLGQSREGLPIGMMFSARYADEATLIRLAAQLEQACPWQKKRPKLGGWINSEQA
ncbi:amidase [Sphingomonas sp. AR_OL41]|uniref:amidase n=1 Tax=Sphingomonas sp. AR_OL41 TaxID=3042729 RepID=UPI002480CBE0|nr:amidase [Sphingomonas sp. AR_OL41]MDH7973664.1 amidase [Sphingomonas sp. AR_OL41]